MNQFQSLMTAITMLSASLSLSALAAGKAKHKGHQAHEHGHAKLNLLVEGNKLTAQLEAPSESIYGFEHEAKTDADKKKRDAGGEKLKANFGKMVIVDSAYGCTYTNKSLELHAAEKEGENAGKTAKAGEKTHEGSGDHSETHAEFVADCQKPLAGAKVNFGFGKIFPRVKEVKVQVLSGEKQSGADIDNDKGSVTL